MKHKKYVINIAKIGVQSGQILLDGYYYCELDKEAFEYYKNQYGGYSENKSKPYLQKVIEPIILNANGTIRTFGYWNGLQNNLFLNFKEHCNLSDANSLQSAIKHFECKLDNDNDKYDVWGKGVYKANKSEIVIQYYVNWLGNYYLRESKGKILSDSAFVILKQYDYKMDKTYAVEKLFKFRRFKNKPDSTNFITKHPKRFGNRYKNP